MQQILENDILIGVKFTTGDQEIILATKKGNANRFNEKDVRDMGRTARGVRGIRLNLGDEVREYFRCPIRRLRIKWSCRLLRSFQYFSKHLRRACLVVSSLAFYVPNSF